MKDIFSILIVFALCANLVTAQEPPKPGSPVIGWDSLASLIRYPEVPRRAGMEGAAFVFGSIDTSGSIDTVTIYAIEPFKEAVRRAIYSTKWQHIKHMHSSLHFNVHFFISNRKRVNVEVEPFKPVH